MFLLRLAWAVVHALFAKKADLVAENLALRQQLIVFRRKVGRPRLGRRDRIFWLCSPVLGTDGGTPRSSSSPRPWSAGTGRASSTTGPGEADARAVDQRLIPRSVVCTIATRSERRSHPAVGYLLLRDRCVWAKASRHSSSVPLTRYDTQPSAQRSARMKFVVRTRPTGQDLVSGMDSVQ